jgi:mono/diheme cytochrome c family protein
MKRATAYALLLGALGALATCIPATCASVEHVSAPAVVASYATVVRPIFESRCIGCHGAEKQKGKLRLDLPDSIRAGGEDGPVFVAGKPAESEILRRLRLPLDDEDHMPPKDKLQPGADEIRALEAWIGAGAPFEGAVAQLAPFLAAPERVVHIAAAPNAALVALREALIHVEPSAPGSNGLRIDCAAIAVRVDDALAKQLLGPVREQVVDLSLARAAISDATLDLLAKMPHLKRLDLRGTAVSDRGIAKLVHLGELEELIVAQAKLSDASLDTLLACKSMKSVFLWRSGLSAEAIARLRQARPALYVDAGDKPDASVAEVEPEIHFTSDAPIPGAPLAGSAEAPVNAKCPITGDPVNPKYTVVHAGRVIGFCCPNCPAEFAKDPERYAAKIP